jgi:D-amino-acid dehydrogenase
VRHPADVAVIGGGLLGWSAAYRLVRDGARVTVIDRGDAGYATQAGAGIIAPGASFRSPAPFFPLAAAAMRYYPRLLEELAEDGAGETGYRTVGGLFVARDDEEAARLPETMAIIAERRASGLGNIGELTMLTGAEAKERFPALANLPGAIHLADAARVDGRLLRKALMRAAIGRGARFRGGAASLRVEPGRATALLDGEPVPSDGVLVAAGAWSSALAEQAGLRLPVYPQRGQIVHLAMPDAETVTWPIVEGYYTHYILTFGPNRVVFGATREHDSGYDVRTTAGGLHEVLTEALRVAPGLAAATIAEIRVGLRPFSPDQLPVLGRAPGLDNLYFATGHGPSGLQLGPYSGAAVAGCILGESPEIALAPFDVARFQ